MCHSMACKFIAFFKPVFNDGAGGTINEGEPSRRNWAAIGILARICNFGDFTDSSSIHLYIQTEI